MKRHLVLKFVFAGWLMCPAAGVASQAQTQSEAQSNTTPNQARIHVTDVTARNATVNIRVQGSASDIKVHLNGNDVSSRFSLTDCDGATCETATLAEADGLRAAKNVLSVDAGSGITGRLRFDGAPLSASASHSAVPHLSAMALTSGQPQSISRGISSPFLPPTVTLKTGYNGGWNGKVDASNPWLIVGTQGYPITEPANCGGSPIYMAEVLDRQTLTEKTSAPESSPQCFANSAALKTYLSALNKAGAASDLVIVASNYGTSPDPG